jgi:hypothetical protein
MNLRRARIGDAGALALIFHRAVQEGTAHLYTQPQRDDWSPECPTEAEYVDRLDGLTTFVAEIEDTPAGFLAMDGALIDLLFVRNRPERGFVSGEPNLDHHFWPAVPIDVSVI